MSFGREPEVTNNQDRTWMDMPGWLRNYYQNLSTGAQASNERADGLRQMYSGLTEDERGFMASNADNVRQRNEDARLAATQQEELLARLAAANAGNPFGAAEGSSTDRNGEVGGFGGFDPATGHYTNAGGGGGFNYQQTYDDQMGRLSGGGGISVGYGNTAAEATRNARG